MNFVLRFLLNLSITPIPSQELNELYAEFSSEFVYYSLPAEELNEIYAAFLTEFVYYSVTS